MIRLLFAFLIAAELFRPDAYGQRKGNILTIGDSNGAGVNGWPEQLRKLIPDYSIVNKSVSGNTIGFDNNGNQKLNTLRNIDSCLDQAYNELPAGSQLNNILICLGTNDTKRIFLDRQAEVPENLAKLIVAIKDYMVRNGKSLPEIGIITPPPMDEEKLDKEKYGGGDERIRSNNKQFKKVAEKNGVAFLETYKQLKKDFSSKTPDGVHLNAEAQMEVAKEIQKYLKM